MRAFEEVVIDEVLDKLHGVRENMILLGDFVMNLGFVNPLVLLPWMSLEALSHSPHRDGNVLV